MKKILLLLISFVCFSHAQAVINIVSGEKYYFLCFAYDQGSMKLGAYHNQAPYVYYDYTSNNLSEDSYWVVTQKGSGYTIQNAVSKEYIIYKEGRLTNDQGEFVAKGLQLSTTATNNYSLWTFQEQMDGSVVIRSAADNSIGFNVRLDGTGLVGTYSVTNSSNERFYVYNEKGESITQKDDSGTVTPDKPDVTGDYGITEDGEYWETVGVKSPIVFTTSTDNPVYYTIQNIRSEKWVFVANSEVYQSSSSRTRFYFVKENSGIKIYTDLGQYVSTSFLASGEGKSPLMMLQGGTSGTNIWDVAYTYPGYTFYKLDNIYQGGYGAQQQSKYMYWNDYNQSVIGLYDFDEGSTFRFFSSDQRHIDNLRAQGINFEGGSSGSGAMGSYVSTLRINKKDLIFDTKEGVYYFPLSESFRGNNEFVGELSVTFQQQDKNYAIRINENAVDAEGKISIGDIDCLKDYEIAVYDDTDTKVASAPLRFTFLPIVEIACSSCNRDYYTTGTIRVTDPGTLGYDSTFIAAYRYRGASAQNYDKKSYAIKLRDKNGESVDREFFGLREDNNWILDAMAVDQACMRNRVSTDLWNDFAVHPYHRREGWEKKARQGTRGRFVEVFLNGTYHGVYCMTEKMDRKQLKLKKYVEQTDSTAAEIHGTLYKSAQWGYEVFMGHEPGSQYFPGYSPKSYNNNTRSETWAEYEIKYPDWEEEKIDWGPLWNAINFTATSDDYDFYRQFDNYFDAVNIDDYYLFIELILASDNHGKNMFFYNYDKMGSKHTKKIGVAPWDLDGTWGRRWDGSQYYTGARQDFTNFLWSYEHGTHTLFHRLAQMQYINWAERLAARYAELRPTFFENENLKERFTTYRDLFVESGADLREQKMWSDLHDNISGDVDYICDWIDERIEYLDRQYDFDPVAVGVDDLVKTVHVSVAGGKNCISVSTTTPQTLKLYNVSGTLIRTIEVGAGQTIINGLDKGVYVMNGQKVIVN